MSNNSNNNSGNDSTNARFSTIEIPTIEGHIALVEPVIMADKPVSAEPNKELWEAAASPQVHGKARKGNDGIQRNALGLESTAEMKHVAKIWQDKCTPFSGMIATEYDRGTMKQDIHLPLSKLEIVANGHLRADLDVEDSVPFDLTERSLTNISYLSGVPNAVIKWLSQTDEHRKDAAKYLNEGIAKRSKIEQSLAVPEEAREYTFRTRPTSWAEPEGDKTIRAVVTDFYETRLSNMEGLSIIADALPGEPDLDSVLCSHWHDDGDTMTGNLLLPDRMKSMPDSDYGIGIQFRNSEVGTASLLIEPFLFRAICLNGMIWGRSNSKIKVGMSQRHAGRIDLEALRAATKLVVASALTNGESLLTLFQSAKEVKVQRVDRMIAYLSAKNNLGKKQAQEWFSAWKVEPDENAFGVINGLTRAAQEFSTDKRVEMETMASLVLAPSLEMDLRGLMERWDNMDRAASMIDDEQVENLLTVSVSR